MESTLAKDLNAALDAASPGSVAPSHSGHKHKHKHHHRHHHHSSEDGDSPHGPHRRTPHSAEETDDQRHHHRHHHHHHHHHRDASGGHHHHHRHAQVEQRSPIQKLIDAFRELPSLARCPSSQLTKFCLQVYAVASSMRGAYCLDEFPIELEDWESIADVLRDFPLAHDSLLFIYEPSSRRLMIANKYLLSFRLKAQLDEERDLPDQWFVKFDRQGKSSFVQQDEIPFFNRSLRMLVNMLEPVMEEEATLPLLEMPKDWISETADQKQAMLRFLTIQHFLFNYPVIYVLEDSGETFEDCIERLQHSKAWIGKVFLEGEREKEDLMFVKCTFPQNLFAPDDMEITDETAQTTLTDLSDRLQTRFLRLLDLADVRKVWRDVAVTVEGPLPHMVALEKTDRRRWDLAGRSWSSFVPSEVGSAGHWVGLSSSSADTTPGSEY